MYRTLVEKQQKLKGGLSKESHALVKTNKALSKHMDEIWYLASPDKKPFAGKRYSKGDFLFSNTDLGSPTSALSTSQQLNDLKQVGDTRSQCLSTPPRIFKRKNLRDHIPSPTSDKFTAAKKGVRDGKGLHKHTSAFLHVENLHHEDTTSEKNLGQQGQVGLSEKEFVQASKSPINLNLPSGQSLKKCNGFDERQNLTLANKRLSFGQKLKELENSQSNTISSQYNLPLKSQTIVKHHQPQACEKDNYSIEEAHRQQSRVDNTTTIIDQVIEKAGINLDLNEKSLFQQHAQHMSHQTGGYQSTVGSSIAPGEQMQYQSVQFAGEQGINEPNRGFERLTNSQHVLLKASETGLSSVQMSEKNRVFKERLQLLPGNKRGQDLDQVRGIKTSQKFLEKQRQNPSKKGQNQLHNAFYRPRDSSLPTMQLKKSLRILNNSPTIAQRSSSQNRIMPNSNLNQSVKRIPIQSPLKGQQNYRQNQSSTRVGRYDSNPQKYRQDKTPLQIPSKSALYQTKMVISQHQQTQQVNLTRSLDKIEPIETQKQQIPRFETTYEQTSILNSVSQLDLDDTVKQLARKFYQTKTSQRDNSNNAIEPQIRSTIQFEVSAPSARRQTIQIDKSRRQSVFTDKLDKTINIDQQVPQQEVKDFENEQNLLKSQARLIVKPQNNPTHESRNETNELLQVDNEALMHSVPLIGEDQRNLQTVAPEKFNKNIVGRLDETKNTNKSQDDKTKFPYDKSKSLRQLSGRGSKDKKVEIQENVSSFKGSKETKSSGIRKGFNLQARKARKIALQSQQSSKSKSQKPSSQNSFIQEDSSEAIDQIQQKKLGYSYSLQRKNEKAYYKKDYTPMILGKYRFGLYQKNPNNDPAKPGTLNFSQLARERFKDSNEQFMGYYSNQVDNLRKTRLFLAREINKNPQSHAFVKQYREQDPFLNYVHAQFKQEAKKFDKKVFEELEAKQIENRGIVRTEGIEQTKTIRDNFGIRVGKDNIPLKKEKNELTKIKSEKPKDLAFTEQKDEEQFFQNKREEKKNHLRSYMDKLMKNARKQVNQQEKADKPAIKVVPLGDKRKSAKNIFTRNKQSDQQRSSSSGASNFVIDQELVSDFVDEEDKQMKILTQEKDQHAADYIINKNNNDRSLMLFVQQEQLVFEKELNERRQMMTKFLQILFGGSIESEEAKEMAQNLDQKLVKKYTETSVKHNDSNGNDEKIAEIQEQSLILQKEIIHLITDEIFRTLDFYQLFKINALGHQTMFDKINAENRAKSKPRQRLSESQDKEQNKEKLTSNTLNQIAQAFRHKLNQTQNEIENNKQQDNKTNLESEWQLDEQNSREKMQAKQKFIQQCEKNMVVVLPILLRIYNQSIVLEGYQLNLGLCEALMIALSKFKDIANSFYMDRNNLSDTDFSLILKGISQLTYIKSIQYSNNDFGLKSLAAFDLVMINKTTQYSLKKLHLKNLKISAQTTKQLLEILNQRKNTIKSLALVNVRINNSNSRNLCEFIRNSRHLEELDISWNAIKCSSLFEIVETIGYNRTLKSLNLSFNHLFDQFQVKFSNRTPEQALELKEKAEALEKKKKFMFKKFGEEGLKRLENEGLNSSMLAIKTLRKFIKMNNNLMHLNLTSTGMTSQMLNEFGVAMRRTKSLVSLHLSGNPGINAELRKQICDRAHVKDFEEQWRPDFKQRRNFEYKEDFQGKNSFKLDQMIQFGDQNLVSAQGLSSKLALKNKLQHGQNDVHRKALELNPNELLIFNRYLGHKVEMPGSGQWRMISSDLDQEQRCWVCNLDVYSFIFWSRQFGVDDLDKKMKYGLDELAYENQIYEIEERNEERGIQVDFFKDEKRPQLFPNMVKKVGYPQIYGDWNNWKPQRMYTIEELCFMIDEDRPDVIKQLKKANLISSLCQEPADLNDEELVLYQERIAKKFVQYKSSKNFRKMLSSHCLYKKPFLVNTDSIESVKKIENLGEFSDNSSSETTQFEDSETSSEDSQDETYRSQSDIKMPYSQIMSGRTSVSQTSKSAIKSISRIKNQASRQLYVIPCILKPGKQNFVVQSLIQSGDTSLENKSSLFSKQESAKISLSNMKPAEEQWFVHDMHVPLRREPVPHFVKQLQLQEGRQRVFDYKKSVFKDFKEPSDADFQKMIDHDEEYWKLKRLYKDEAVYNDVVKVFRKHIKQLFNIFITCSADSAFPGVSWLDFATFNEKCKLLEPFPGLEKVAKPDYQPIQANDIDRYFIGTALEQKSACFRFQWLETLCRVANKKFFESRLASTPAEALEMCLQHHYLKHGVANKWSAFRHNYWWCNETDDIIKTNLKGIQKVYRSFWNGFQKTLLKQDAILLFTKHSGIYPVDKEVLYCYGMSQLHLIKEVESKEKYNEKKLCEFIEFLGRLAHQKYLEERGMGIGEKLKLILEDLFAHYGITYKEVEVLEDELSESDPDY